VRSLDSAAYGPRVRDHESEVGAGREHADGMTDRDDFLAWVKTTLYQAELAQR